MQETKDTKKPNQVMLPVLGLLTVLAGGAVIAQNQRAATQQGAPGVTESVAVPEAAGAAARIGTGITEAAVNLDVPYVPTPQAVVDKMLELPNVQKDDIVYDLGCGDGRIVITAAKRFGVSGVGVDIDPQRIRESNENAQKAGVADRVQFLQQDLFKTDFSKATVMTLYLLPEINLRLRPQIFRQVKPGTRISSHAFTMGDWEADQTVQVEGDYPRTVYYWVVPAHVGGTWQWNAAGGPATTLQLNQKFQKVSGTLNSGAATQIGNVKLVGDQISFTLEQGNAKTTFNGRVSGHTITGTMTDANGAREWKATRDPANLPSIEGAAIAEDRV